MIQINDSLINPELIENYYLRPESNSIFIEFSNGASRLLSFKSRESVDSAARKLLVATSKEGHNG